MKPLIGVVPLYDAKLKSLWMIPGYMNGVTEAGGIPIILPLTDDDEIIRQITGTISGLLLTGGQDVSPGLYGQTQLDVCGEICALRDSMESKLLQHILPLDKPVLGICRGIQFLNAYLGGSLYQDLDTQFPSNTEHHMIPPYERYVHDVSIVKNTLLNEIMGDNAKVNSYHHQGVNKVADGLIAAAYAPDGLVEAVEYPSARFMLAVQWHPEWLYCIDDKEKKLFDSFISAADSYR